MFAAFFLSLALGEWGRSKHKNNSNILKTFWLDVDFYLHLSPVEKELISYGQPFIYQKIIADFGGYAYSQIKRVTKK